MIKYYHHYFREYWSEKKLNIESQIKSNNKLKLTKVKVLSNWEKDATINNCADQTEINSEL